MYTYIHLHTPTYTYIYIYMYIHLHTCTCTPTCTCSSLGTTHFTAHALGTRHYKLQQGTPGLVKALQAHQGGPAGLEEACHTVQREHLCLRPLLPGGVPGVVYEEGLRLQGAGAGCVSVHADLVQQGEQDLWNCGLDCNTLETRGRIEDIHTHEIHTYTHVYMNVNIHTYMCICVHVICFHEGREV